MRTDSSEVDGAPNAPRGLDTLFATRVPKEIERERKKRKKNCWKILLVGGIIKATRD